MKKQCPDCGGLGHTYVHKTRYVMSHGWGGMGCGHQVAESYMVPKHCATCNGKGRVQYKASWDKRGNRRR